LPAPANSDVTFEFTRDGYVSVLVGIRTGTKDLEVLPMADSATLSVKDVLTASLGVTLDPEKGIIDVAAPAGEGVKLAMEPPSGVGPLFTAGLMIYANIDPGTITLSAEAQAGPCTFSGLLWRGPTNGSVRVPIAADFITRLISLSCPAEGGTGD